jgi:hypothetical protein
MVCGAEVSDCGYYRWWLRRCWQPRRPELLFIGLNPSRADAERDDPTLRRLLGFARRWGHGSLTVVNLFARISPSPVALRRCADPVGAANDRWIRQALADILAAQAGPVGTVGGAGPAIWLGWGNGGRWRGRQDAVLDGLRPWGVEGQLGCLGLTAGGQPRHPLYAPGDAVLKPFVVARLQPAAAS